MTEQSWWEEPLIKIIVCLTVFLIFFGFLFLTERLKTEKIRQQREEAMPVVAEEFCRNKAYLYECKLEIFGNCSENQKEQDYMLYICENNLEDEKNIHGLILYNYLKRDEKRDEYCVIYPIKTPINYTAGIWLEDKEVVVCVELKGDYKEVFPLSEVIK